MRGLSIVSLVGAIAIAGGSFLDWWSFGPIGTSAWDIPIKYLFTGKAGDGLDTGPILVLLALVLAISLAIGRRLPSLVHRADIRVALMPCPPPLRRARPPSVRSVARRADARQGSAR